MWPFDYVTYLIVNSHFAYIIVERLYQASAAWAAARRAIGTRKGEQET